MKMEMNLDSRNGKKSEGSEKVRWKGRWKDRGQADHPSANLKYYPILSHFLFDTNPQLF
jgi:hypothetical protein